ncbi:unnamed protein product [Amoebophrya sp. A120]|nr:unnamed protein product [Amoebophrya sp. A120]|eukprot:GSA120T00020007001.1
MPSSTLPADATRAHPASVVLTTSSPSASSKPRAAADTTTSDAKEQLDEHDEEQATKELLILSIMDSVMKLDESQLRRTKAAVEKIENSSTVFADKVLRPALLDHLERGVFVKVGMSSVEGCGVIAVRDIPEGTDPFQVCNQFLGLSDTMSVVVSDAELRRRKIPLEVLEMVKSFFAPLTDSDDEGDSGRGGDLEYGVNATGLNSLNVGWYLNHSDTPNVCHFEATEAGTFCTYRTTRAIAKGEELFIDYKELGLEYYENIMH